MDDPENEALPRDYVRGVHAELERLFRDVEKALDSLSRQPLPRVRRATAA
jgi:hypothetical protein